MSTLRLVLRRLPALLRNVPWEAAVVAAALMSVAMHTHAQAGYAEAVRVYVDQQIQLPGGAEVDISVSEPDPRLTLAPCARIEPFVPPGAKLIGRTSLGVRCVEGANWTVYLPVRIKLFMDVLVAARPIARGQLVADADVRSERIDIAPLRGNAVA